MGEIENLFADRTMFFFASWLQQSFMNMYVHIICMNDIEEWPQQKGGRKVGTAAEQKWKHLLFILIHPLAPKNYMKFCSCRKNA
jgi:hypothetical protein